MHYTSVFAELGILNQESFSAFLIRIPYYDLISNNKLLERQDSFIYLVIAIDHKLTFVHLVQNVMKKLQNICFTKIASKGIKKVSCSVLQGLYKTNYFIWSSRVCLHRKNSITTYFQYATKIW